jgi:hypothetical protein
MMDPGHREIIDLLIKGGALRETNCSLYGRRHYEIVQPETHKHDWTVLLANSDAEELYLACNVANCMETRRVQNRRLTFHVDGQPNPFDARGTIFDPKVTG